MKFGALGFAAALVGLASASPIARVSKPPHLFLIGDSTVAVNGGWGDGLLSYLKDPAQGENRAVSGTTTVSWKSNGRWDDLIASIESNANDYEPIVTVQFGHNDQKTLSLDEFTSNLESIATDIKEAGGTPIFITSLTRRNFDGDEVRQDLKDWRDATIAAAQAVGIKYLDLNLASTNYVNAIGEENAIKYNLASNDRTHLNTAGEIVFGRMTLDLLLEARKDLRQYFTSNKALSQKIARGEYATGDE
ncbi:SGNH hydrolase-type esterase domain-containing protein [Aspergillus bertholletiae]|uniref:SGNH hydrolase-type esterase domain-containing protein n=1 Tax=Aspergillus bertholletiae TaxID=1226010 RepID=A0A5N7B3H0_9EURO|nr:SGNH hydrolase-type esterase domain-containing protein [Aspergillus bertholletiae]